MMQCSILRLNNSFIGVDFGVLDELGIKRYHFPAATDFMDGIFSISPVMTTWVCTFLSYKYLGILWQQMTYFLHDRKYTARSPSGLFVLPSDSLGS
jgi:hypothetical protein